MTSLKILFLDNLYFNITSKSNFMYEYIVLYNNIEWSSHIAWFRRQTCYFVASFEERLSVGVGRIETSSYSYQRCQNKSFECDTEVTGVFGLRKRVSSSEGEKRIEVCEGQKHHNLGGWKKWKATSMLHTEIR